MLKTHVAFCIDESGSIGARGLTKPLVESYNKNVDSIRQSVLNEGQEASMTALAFGHRTLKHRILYVGKQVQTVEPLKTSDLNPTGMTPLFDSVYKAVQKLSELDDGNPDTSFLINVITDGEENESYEHGVSKTLKIMDEKMATDRWTFTFLIPEEYIRKFLNKYRISPGNVKEWDASCAEGLEQATVVNVAAFSNYFSNRTKGIKSTRSFYADLSDVTVRKARSELSEITNQVTIIQPTKDCLIRECIENEGYPYIKGAAFYQLVKTERKVQPYKLIAIRTKTSGKIYCGQEARNMLGLNTQSTVRLVPGDHGKFDIFIQSTSYTRKIPANTLVLYWPKVGTQRKVMVSFVGHFDGSSIPNPGRMKIGGRIVNVQSGEVLCEYSEEVGKGTNNQAEYLSLIKLLEMAKENNINRIFIRGDSKLVIKQVKGEWKCKKVSLQPLMNRCKELLSTFNEWHLDHVHREFNKEADSLTR